MVVVGIQEKETTLGAAPLVNARRTLSGSVIGWIRETQEMLDFCAKNTIPSDIELIPIQKVNEAYPRIINSDVRYRFVIDSKSIVTAWK
jgi:alcohol dehydrogenase (NADP+)